MEASAEADEERKKGMKEGTWTITGNWEIAPNVFRMTLRGDPGDCRVPGQFVNVKLDGLFLRRPISICDWDQETQVLVYKVVGQGTRQLSEMKPGTELNLLSGLGNGYDLSRAGDRPLLLGGGVGVPPLLGLARRLREQGKTVTAVLGFNTGSEIILAEDFQALGCDVRLCTADGSVGVKGFVTDALPEMYSYFYTCGPLPMLRAVYRAACTDGQFSLEERMGCGFGA